MRTFYFAPVACSFFLLFFLAYSQRSEIWCLPYFHTCCRRSENLECRSENVLHAARLKYGTQKLRKKSPSAHHRTTLSGISSQLRHLLSRQSEIMLNSNISSRCSYNMVQFGPLTAEIDSGVWGPQQISTGFAS